MPVRGRVPWGIAIGVMLVLTAPGAAAKTTSGDFDGDGRDDLAIGVIGQAVSGDLFAGAVHVVYGGRNGLSARDRIFTQDTPGVAERAESDSFGGALAAGDFDGDGFEDLAIGTPFEALGATSGAGVVQILYGSKGGLRPRGDQLLKLGQKGLGGPPETFDFFGWSLAAGDYGKGGQADLAVGWTGATVGGADRAGSVDVLYGSRRGLKRKGSDRLRQGPGSLAGDDPAVDDSLGWTLASGDFGDDHHDDLAIGVPSDDHFGTGATGAVHVVPGSDGGLRPRQAEYLTQSGLHAAPPADALSEPGDSFGGSLAAGDFGKGGRDDLVAGAPREAVGSVAGAGALSIVYGGSVGLRPETALFLTENDLTPADEPETFEQFGLALAAGELGNEPQDDLVIGIPNETPTSGGPASGGLLRIEGAPQGLLVVGQLVLGQDSEGVEGEEEAGDQFARHLTMGRFDGRGPLDLAVGIPNEDFDPGPVADAGAVAIFRGTVEGLTTDGDRLLFQGVGGLAGAAQQTDFFGSSLSGRGAGVVFD